MWICLSLCHEGIQCPQKQKGRNQLRMQDCCRIRQESSWGIPREWLHQCCASQRERISPDQGERSIHRIESQRAHLWPHLPWNQETNSSRRFLLAQYRQGNACRTSEKHHYRWVYLQSSRVHGSRCEKNQPCWRLGNPVRHVDCLHERGLS